MPLFSLITPIYKVEKYLSQCIESMINQTFRDIEIILVDDGSPDGCARICDEYAASDNRIKVIHKKNGGLVSARQAGSSLVTGNYIVNVDGDDWIDTDYCMKMADIIQKYQPDIVLCGHYNEFEDRKEECKLRYRYGLYSRKEIENEILPTLLHNERCRGFSLTLWAKATRSDLQQQQQLVDVKVNVGEDIACMAPCVFHANSLYIMDDALYHYRQNPASMIHGKNAFDWDGPEIRGRHLERQMNMTYGDLQEQVYRYVAHALFNVAKSQYNNKNVLPGVIDNEIKRELERSYYKEAIQKSDFKGIRPNVMKYIMLFKLTHIIKLMNRLMP